MEQTRSHHGSRGLPRAVRGLGVTVLLVITFAACTTAPPVSSPKVAAEIVGLVAAAEAQAVAERCAVPFLFDGEILNRQQDVDYLWTGLREQGFTSPAARAAEITPVTTGSYRRFADTTEVRFFFRRYAGSDGVLVTATGFPEPVLLLMAPGEQGEAQILGIRVGER